MQSRARRNFLSCVRVCVCVRVINLGSCFAERAGEAVLRPAWWRRSSWRGRAEFAQPSCFSLLTVRGVCGGRSFSVPYAPWTFPAPREQCAFPGSLCRDPPRHALPIQVLRCSLPVVSCFLSRRGWSVPAGSPGGRPPLQPECDRVEFGRHLAGLNQAGPLNLSRTLEPPEIFNNPDAQVTCWTDSIRLSGWDPGLPE